jgi:hypothetical protein
MIAECHYWSPKRLGQPDREEAEANARLIAAAPELLAALKALIIDWDAIDSDAQVPEEINDNAHWKAARAAIAKVEGR